MTSGGGMADTVGTLSDLLDELSEGADGESVRLGDLLSGLGGRSHGPLLFAPAFFALMPTGAIPGVAIGAGVLILLVAIQSVISPNSLWLPQRLLDIELGREKVDASIRMARPVARILDKPLRPRLSALVDGPMQIVAAVLCLAMGALMLPFAFIPFAAALPSAAVCAVGLALTARDGAAMVVALAATAASAVAAYEFLV